MRSMVCTLCVSQRVCVSVSKENLFFFFSVGRCPNGICRVVVWCGGVWVEVGHQGKEFNKSCRKRSGSAISERRPTTSKNSDKDSAGMSSSWKALSTRSEAS